MGKVTWMIIGNKVFDDNHTYIMGILNVTPDSFSDGGNWNSLDAALKHAELMISQGADVIDIGGESTRPGHTQISVQEEIERVVPVIEKITSIWDVPVSIDTYKPRVADAALTAGAAMVNDIWGFRYEGVDCLGNNCTRDCTSGRRLAEITAAHGAACCLMHNRSVAEYGDILEEMRADFGISVRIAKEAGIPDERIMLDPGIGFGKTYEMNLRVLKNLDAFNDLGFPMLLGTSRKSVIGTALGLPADQREEGTLATTVMAAEQGYRFVRVHDVEKNKRAIQMVEAIRDCR